METLINGLHHVTTLAGDTQHNVDFYTDLLGLRLVKKTVNFDAPDVYHLYYGNETGSPGTILTFFPYGTGLPRGRKGVGQLTYTAFSVPTASMQFWIDRLHERTIPYAGPYKRFSESYLQFEDYDGAGIELVFSDSDQRPGWDNGQIPSDFAIRGFYTVTLNVQNPDRTVQLLTEIMQHKQVGEEQGRIRFSAGTGGPGNFVDVQVSPTGVRALQGAGSVHHVAFSTDSDDTQQIIREKLMLAGFQPTTVQDRQYFNSIYFREPGGILFEIATNPPGFTVDESLAELGQNLKLPPQYESRRESLEQALPVIS